MATPKFTTYLEPYSHSRAINDWTPASIKTALAGMSGGYYASAAGLADSILGDDRVQAALGTRIKAFLGLPLTFEPSDEKNARAVKAAQDLDLDFWNIAPEQTLYQMLSYGWLLGVALVRFNWKRVNGRWLPEFSVWHPSNVRYETKKRLWLAKVVSETGKEQEIPVENSLEWFLFTPYGADRPWTNALIRPLAIPFLMKVYAVGDWARNSEVHGGAIKAVTVPGSTSDEVLKKIVKDAQELGSDGVMGLREGQKLELLEVSENVWQGFQGLISWADKAIATSILGQNMTTEPQANQNGVTGAREVRQDILESDSETAATAIHHGALVWWSLFNYGDATLAPYPMWDTLPPPEDGKIYEYHLKVGVIRKNEVRAKLGLPPLSKKEGGEELIALQDSNPPPPPLEKGENKAANSAALAEKNQAEKKQNGLVAGQAYVDKVVDKAAKRAAAVLKSDVGNIMDLIDEASDPEDLRNRLLGYYQGMSPLELAELTTKAMVMAHLAGRYSEVMG
jgi:phage gp29-like protein